MKLAHSFICNYHYLVNALPWLKFNFDTWFELIRFFLIWGLDCLQQTLQLWISNVLSKEHEISWFKINYSKKNKIANKNIQQICNRNFGSTFCWDRIWRPYLHILAKRVSNFSFRWKPLELTLNHQFPQKTM